MNRPRLSHGVNDIAFDDAGKAYLDLQAGFGSVLLGHANARIVAALSEQVGKLWISGHHRTAIAEAARRDIADFLPVGHRLVDFPSTGMEAVELALRIASNVTGRRVFVGFERGMHGKSIVTSTLCWPNTFTALPEIVRLPFVPQYDEDAVLDSLAETLAERDVAAVLIEPILGTGGGWSASNRFHQRATELCRQSGALTIYDEVLTGSYRAGSCFQVESLGVAPDVLVMGKAMGNGFPVSAVSVRDDIEVVPEMLPGSTFANNPLAAAAVRATLAEMRRVDVQARVEFIGDVIAERLTGLGALGFSLRGRGALWILDGPTALQPRIVEETLGAGVLLSTSGSVLRLLPPATITHENLERACKVVHDACVRAAGG